VGVNPRVCVFRKVLRQKDLAHLMYARSHRITIAAPRLRATRYASARENGGRVNGVR